MDVSYLVVKHDARGEGDEPEEDFGGYVRKDARHARCIVSNLFV